MEAETRGDQDAIDRAIRSGAVERAITDGQCEGNAVGRALGSISQAPPILDRVPQLTRRGVPLRCPSTLD